MWGKEVGKDGAACTAGKAILPMLLSIVNPKMPRTWFMVTALHVAASWQTQKHTHTHTQVDAHAGLQHE